MYKNKRGISPVVATVLLIVIVLVIALFVILWARSWFAEKIQKDLGEGEILIEEVCKSVGFKAEVSSSGKVSVENTRNVPIYGVKVIKVGTGSKKEMGSARRSGPALQPGQTDTLTLTLNSGATLQKDQTVIVRPILAGTTQSSKVKREYTCTGDDNSVTTKVI